MKKLIKNNNLDKKIAEIAALVNAGKFSEALRFLDSGRESLGHLQIFHNMLGVTYSGLRDHDSAVKHFLNSVKVNPLDPLPFTGIANSLAKNLQFEEAEKYYKLALVVDENYRDAIVGLGVVNFQRSNYTECEDHFRKALESKPNDSTILTNLANTYSAIFNIPCIPHIN
jgi:tetratricopeptide (TPR) repeat protein